MADDRIDLVDWCDVAAVGALARAAWHLAEVEDPVRFTLEEISSSVEVDGIADEVAAALREAHEAGLRERIDVIDCDACGERHLTERGAAIVAENRALRRELVALAGRLSEALDVALCGGIDGAHHKAWVIDQMVRHLTGDGYAAWVAAARDGEDGPETYSWDEGIAP